MTLPGPRPHILVLTSLFRTPRERVRAPFTSEFLAALQEFAEVELICPIPWAPDIAAVRARPDWARYVGFDRDTVVDGVPVHYVRYPMLPKVSGVIQPWLEAQAALPVARRLHARRPVDLVNGRFVYPDGVAAAKVARALGAPLMLTALGTDINVYASQRFKQGQVRAALKQAAHVSAVSPALADRMIELGADPARVSAAVNGIDLDRFRPDGASLLRERLGLPREARVLVCLARLSVEKGLPVLVESVGQLQAAGRLDFHTVLIGGGPERAALEAQVQQLGLAGRVHFAGEVAHAEVPQWLRGADVFCLPSYREGTPNVVIEALATGIPVVSTAVGGTPLLLNERNGLLVPVGDAPALAQALSQTKQGVVAGQYEPAQVRASVAHMSWRSEARRHVELLQALRPLPGAISGPRGAGA
ncbi:MAG: hypothetical protein RL722_2140 [Pseudomonadota bacterium]|jgi:glycosyltransferase involved in cell wall biosynthesis